MSDLFEQQSPMVQIAFVEPKGRAPRIEEKPFLGYINLRGKANYTGFQAGVLKALGCEPPLVANTVVIEGQNRIFWLGPDEWLVQTPGAEVESVQAALKKALDGVFSSVVDNTSGLTSLIIEGENAGQLLARDCPLDLHAREFKFGQCAQTRLAKSNMLITPLADAAGFEIIIRRSFADYIGRWMLDALVEFE